MSKAKWASICALVVLLVFLIGCGTEKQADIQGKMKDDLDGYWYAAVYSPNDSSAKYTTYELTLDDDGSGTILISQSADDFRWAIPNSKDLKALDDKTPTSISVSWNRSSETNVVIFSGNDSNAADKNRRDFNMTYLIDTDETQSTYLKLVDSDVNRTVDDRDAGLAYCSFYQSQKVAQNNAATS